MNSFTPDQIEAMRQAVANFDQSTPKTPNVFDLSNPPKTPYLHQEFPKIVYHYGKSKAPRYKQGKTAIGEPLTEYISAKHVTMTVRNADELAQARKRGYEEKPRVFGEPERPDADEEDVEFSAEAIEQLEKEPELEEAPTPRRRGPKAKVAVAE